jgi:hypothetical protein
MYVEYTEKRLRERESIKENFLAFVTQRNPRTLGSFLEGSMEEGALFRDA